MDLSYLFIVLNYTLKPTSYKKSTFYYPLEEGGPPLPPPCLFVDAACKQRAGGHAPSCSLLCSGRLNEGICRYVASPPDQTRREGLLKAGTPDVRRDPTIYGVSHRNWDTGAATHILSVSVSNNVI